MAKKSHDEIDNFFEHGLDLGNRTIYLGSASYGDDGTETGVDFLMTEKLIKGLHVLETTAPNGDKPITIIMNNIGGDVIHGMAIYDAIKACKNHVTIKVFGNVMSMGGYILQAADTRLLAPNSVFMFHAGYDGYTTNHPDIIKRWVEFHKDKFSPILNNILLTAINNKRILNEEKMMTMKEFEKHNLLDTILLASEAVEWGFADALIDEE